MTPAQIRAKLKSRGYLMADIARECGVSDPAVRNSIYGLPFPSQTVRRHISNILDIPVGVLWPKEASYANGSNKIST